VGTYATDLVGAGGSGAGYDKKKDKRNTRWLDKVILCLLPVPSSQLLHFSSPPILGYVITFSCQQPFPPPPPGAFDDTQNTTPPSASHFFAIRKTHFDVILRTTKRFAHTYPCLPHARMIMYTHPYLGSLYFLLTLSLPHSSPIHTSSYPFFPF
jgi:hypothetical protein